MVGASPLSRRALSEIINTQPGISVIETAPDPLVATEMIRALNPDVLILDTEIPSMDGLDFLERLMRLRPMPVVMVATLTERGAEMTLRALELGAIDFVARPELDIDASMQEYAGEIAFKIRAAMLARLKRRAVLANTPEAAARILPSIANPRVSTGKLIIIGASSGGTEAIKEVLVKLPPDCPAVLIAQHMPEGFTRPFANRLNNLCRISVKEAEHGEHVLPGHAYVAPGHSHLLLKRSGVHYMTELSQSVPVNRHRPSVDVLFRSAASNAGEYAVGVILTGMGKDGAEGLREMRLAGAHTFAQDEASCVVFGMPREAIALDAVAEVAPIYEMARRIVQHLNERGAAGTR